MSTFTQHYFKHPHDSCAAFTNKRQSNTDISKASASVILYSNPQTSNSTTSLKFFLSLFWCVYGRLKTADYVRSSCQSHVTVTPCSLTYWLIPCDALRQFLKQGLCLLRGMYIMSTEPPPEHSQAFWSQL